MDNNYEALLKLYIKSEIEKNTNQEKPLTQEELIQIISNRITSTQNESKKTVDAEPTQSYKNATKPVKPQKTIISTPEPQIDTQADTDWATRQLNQVYSIAYFYHTNVNMRDTVFSHVKQLSICIGVSVDGVREIIAASITDNVSFYTWRDLLNTVKERGVDEILMACQSNTHGLADAIHEVYPKTDILPYLPYTINYCKNYLSSNDIKQYIEDLNALFLAKTLDVAKTDLELFHDRWASQYPILARHLTSNWQAITPIYRYDPAFRRILCSVYAIESVYSTIRRMLGTRRIFKTNKELLDMVQTIDTKAITKRTIWGWKKEAMATLSTMFEDVLYKYLK